MATLSPSPDARPQNEWWFSLSPGLSDEDRLQKIKQSTQRYAERFGCPPVDVPRVVMVGKTPMLAYAMPVEHAIAAPQSVIIETSTAEDEECIMQLTLL